MSTIFYSDLRRLVECAKQCDETDLAKQFEAVLDQLENTHFTDHRDLWEYTGDDNVHPLRKVMTQAARDYKAAEKQIAEEHKHTVLPQGKYDTKVVAVDPKDLRGWHHDIPEELIGSAIVIIQTLTNRAELDASMHYWGSGAAWDDQRRSITYYIQPISEGTALVCEDRGGYVMLKKNLFVGIADWNAVRQGTMPLPESWLR
jgi:hypothetical protein